MYFFWIIAQISLAVSAPSTRSRLNLFIESLIVYLALASSLLKVGRLLVPPRGRSSRERFPTPLVVPFRSSVDPIELSSVVVLIT